MVFITGLAETVSPVVALNPVAGVHVYVSAPITDNVVEFPVQIVAGGYLKLVKG